MSDATATMPTSSQSQDTVPIELTLLAPRNREAVLLLADREAVMEKGEDGVFRATVDLPDGRHPYRFRIRSKSWFFEPDQWVDVIDPYAREIDSDGKNAILEIQGGERISHPYSWKHDDVPLPPNDRLVIYELHVADFSGGKGRFLDLLDRLDYLADLGVNAIELMPVKDNPGRYSWGYNPRHFFAPDTDYGSGVDLKRVVDECHGRGIRVFVDGVYNHGEASMPLAHIDHDYWFRREPKDPEFNWGPEFDYAFHDDEHDIWPARRFVTDAIHWWVSEFHLDGIRFDACRQIDSFETLGIMAETARDAAGPKPFYNVAEHVPQTPAVCGPGGPMDAAWHDNFYHCVKDLVCTDALDVERLKSVIDGRREGFAAAVDMVNYCSNHDHNHLLGDLGDHGIFDDVAFAKARQAAAICFTSLGVPLLWMGEEFGEYKYKSEEGGRLDWRLLEGERNARLHAFYRQLIALRRSSESLRGDDIDFFYEPLEQRLLAWSRGDSVAVIANFGDTDRTLEIAAWPEGDWGRLEDPDDRLDPSAVAIPAFEARIYVRRS
jgi:1,4-alpha-glucan branching enzyme